MTVATAGSCRLEGNCQMGLAQAQAFRLCIHWTDGGVGCWKGQLNSNQVLF